MRSVKNRWVLCYWFIDCNEYRYEFFLKFFLILLNCLEIFHYLSITRSWNDFFEFLNVPTILPCCSVYIFVVVLVGFLSFYTMIGATYCRQTMAYMVRGNRWRTKRSVPSLITSQRLVQSNTGNIVANCRRQLEGISVLWMSIDWLTFREH